MDYSIRKLEKDREWWIDFRGSKPSNSNVHYDMCTVVIKDLNTAISLLKTGNKK